MTDEPRNPFVPRLDRQVVIDIATDGYDWDYNRITEIGTTEMWKGVPTASVGRWHFVPTDIDAEASPHPNASTFCDALGSIKTWLSASGPTQLLAYNEPYRERFINAELARCSCDEKLGDMVQVVDVLTLAQWLHPTQLCSINWLCDRYGIDISPWHEKDLVKRCDIVRQIYEGLMAEHGKTTSKEGQA